MILKYFGYNFIKIMKKILLIFIFLIFSLNAGTTTLQVVKMKDEEKQILTEILNYINSEVKISKDGIDTFTGTSNPLTLEMIWYDPINFFGVSGDREYNCPKTLKQNVRLHLNNPIFNFQLKDITNADILNGFEWKGVFTVNTDAIKLEIDKEEFLNNHNIIKELDCLLMIRSVDQYNPFLNLYLPEELKTENASDYILRYNNIWLNFNNDKSAYIYHLFISNYKNKILSTNFLIEVIKDCNYDNTDEICNLLR